MIAVDVTDPDVHVVIEVGRDIAIHRGSAPSDAVILDGDAVDVLEQLSMRAPSRSCRNTSRLMTPRSWMICFFGISWFSRTRLKSKFTSLASSSGAKEHLPADDAAQLDDPLLRHQLIRAGPA